MGQKTETAPAGDRRGSEDALLGGKRGSEPTAPSDGSQGPIVIGKLRKNAREDIRIALDQYQGNRYCDIRIVVPGDSGDDRCTKAGITVKFSALADLRRLLEEAEREARARGLI